MSLTHYKNSWMWCCQRQNGEFVGKQYWWLELICIYVFLWIMEFRLLSSHSTEGFVCLVLLWHVYSWENLSCFQPEFKWLSRYRNFSLTLMFNRLWRQFSLSLTRWRAPRRARCASMFVLVPAAVRLGAPMAVPSSVPRRVISTADVQSPRLRSQPRTQSSSFSRRLICCRRLGSRQPFDAALASLSPKLIQFWRRLRRFCFSRKAWHYTAAFGPAYDPSSLALSLSLSYFSDAW